MENFELSVQRFDEFAEEYASRFDNVSGYFNQLSWFVSQVKKKQPGYFGIGLRPRQCDQISEKPLS